MVKEQIKLPLRVGYDITIQGIRIRLGRSIVTLLGVVFGIAFLMSVLVSQIIRQGVRDEEELRQAIKRMYNMLTTEAGVPKGRQYGIVQVGPLNVKEERFLKRISEEKPDQINWYSSGDVSVKNAGDLQLNKASLDKIGENASTVFLMGKGTPPSIEWSSLLTSARQKVVASTRKDLSLGNIGDVRFVALDRELRPEEIAKMDKEKRKEHFRYVWILIISLLVTIIGIINSMLMSVTERFREIGTMKCLGALSSFIRQVFLIESSIIGLIGSFLGAIMGVIFSFIAYGITYGFPLVFSSLDFGGVFFAFMASLVAGTIFAVIAAIYPANFASKMVPATALRTNV